MTTNTQPFFIVSSGRSGTAMLHKVFSAVPDVEMHHEYMVHIVQPLAVKRYMGGIGAYEARHCLAQTHGAAVRYSGCGHWGDSSNKLSWLIPELSKLMPAAKFVHLVRDGRKVTSSYFHKLGNECYDDRSTAVLTAHARDPAKNPAPPPEKKYWWPIPADGTAMAECFAKFGQFERIAWHWAEINRVILAALSELPKDRKTFVRLEALEVSALDVEALFDFLDLPYHPQHFEMFARPHNVNRPQDHILDADQSMKFARIASAMMDTLGYADKPEYVVNY